MNYIEDKDIDNFLRHLIANNHELRMVFGGFCAFVFLYGMFVGYIIWRVVI